MAVIDIRAESSGRTRVLFDFRIRAGRRDDVARITDAMTRSRAGTPAEAPILRAEPQAASARSTSRPVTLPSRSRISAS
jgi:hypothetical protein